jgi:DNA (cytosine-5)-methyltransferase 1
MIKVFDFFSGCGGTSAGLQRAGMEVVLGLDNNPHAAATFRVNCPKAKFIEQDIKTVDPSILKPYVSKTNVATLFCGCAPCQPFSKQNRHSNGADERRTLLFEFTRFVRYWKPDFGLVENVPGLQRVERHSGPLDYFLDQLKDLQYSFDLGVLPALWYGVPQTRERLILLASRRPGLTLPPATHGLDKRPFSTVRDWIGSMPPLRAGQTHTRDPDHQAASLSPINLARISATPEGGGREAWPRSLWLECHKDHVGHSDVYGRLAWDRPASGLTTRCISYSNGRFGHPDQDRALSVREAACLQTFPRSYRFVGSLTSKACQIGNAVPPLMATHIGKTIIAHAN